MHSIIITVCPFEVLMIGQMILWRIYVFLNTRDLLTNPFKKQMIFIVFPSVSTRNSKIVDRK